MMEWTEEKIDIMYKMLVKCKTSAAISKVLGCSRNAVAGKIHREPRLREVANMRYKPPSTGTGNHPNSRRVVPKVVGNKVNLPLPEATDKKPTAGRPMAALGTKGNCRGYCLWPVNDAEIEELHLFCGAPTGDHLYCEAHQPIANQPVRARGRPSKTQVSDDHRTYPEPQRKWR